MVKFQRILVVRLSGIGDILFSLPVTNMLKQNFPDCKLTFLTKKTFALLLEGFPSVDNVITVDNEVFNSKNLKKICQTTISLIQKLRQEHFQLVVDLHGLGKTAFISFITGSKNRWGIIRKKLSKGFYDISQPIFDSLHRIDLNCLLLEKSGLQKIPIENRFQLPETALKTAKSLWQEWGLSLEHPTIFIQPFTNFNRKNWPLEHYLTVANYWKNYDIQIIFGGGPGDRDKLHQIANHFPVAAGRANLLTTGGLMKLSTLILGGDTGMLHLAVGLGKKVLMLMDGSEFRKFHPYQHPEWVLTPERSFQIKEITPERVLKSITEVLNRTQ